MSDVTNKEQAQEALPLNGSQPAAIQTTQPKTALTKPEASKAPIMMGADGLQLTSLDDMWRLCTIIASSGLAPKAYDNKPEKIFIAVEMGMELGMKPMAAIQSIGVVNGIPSLYGDGFLGKCLSNPLHEWHKEWYEGEGDQLTAHCIVKRKGHEEHHVSFSVKDAKDAALLEKDVWKKNRKRMLMWRARSAFRDKYADVLKGFKIYEEVIDYPEEAGNMGAPNNRPKFDDEPEVPAQPAQTVPVQAEEAVFEEVAQ